MTPRQRVDSAIQQQEPDRVPTDFLATPEIWDRLVESLQPDTGHIRPSEFINLAQEALLRHFEIDCRVLSYDMFCAPPEWVVADGAAVDWWGTLNRSTPNRMWRRRNPDGTLNDIWGTHTQRVENQSGAYEEFVTWPLGDASTVEDLRRHAWPEPDWWDFSPLPDILRWLDEYDEYHIRFRIGSIFEIAWQLRGMEQFLMDLALNPEIPLYIMDRLTEVAVENTRRVLEIAGERIDMVYFYDDVATQNSLLISKKMWERFVRPRHARLIEAARAYEKPVMYHCDGAIAPLIPDLIELGIDVLNPIQPDAKGMDPRGLKERFGTRLTFHGGIDIIRTLPQGTPEEVATEVRERVNVLGTGGGYILASSHHIQSDTPLANVHAMYDPSLRYWSDG
ncbi:MAG: hypothetical protein M5U01_02175 [Ardenticatenaceae bacterium]|nr:hypothetical protein [Ardenticatenaceae bacterium]HBY94716.1 hypothetical protein [Chloroflexota bacterium]